MTATRPTMIWIGTLATIALLVVLLRDILLPFVAGIALAYLLDPVVERIERLGVNRTVAALGIVGLFIIGVGGVLVLVAPLLGTEVAAFIEKILPNTSENCKPSSIIRAAHGCARSSAKD
jgi:predicted PurR-regulated permease PerM